jgi:ataxin-3
MDSIFFEKQEGQLCAQHCLNSLLQGPIFTAVDLAGYARQLDEEEQATMAEGGFTNPEFLRFMQQPSSNMDDSGFFSVQVIAKALSMWNLELESLTSPQMKRALDDPTTQKAFICNHDSHWLTVRKLGQQV